MECLRKDELLKRLKNQNKKEPFRLTEISLENMDLSGCDLKNIDFTWSDFKNVIFDGADLSGCILENTYFSQCTLKQTLFINVNLKAANLRFCDLSHANICGANLLCTVLEGANLEGIIFDENTKFFRLYCPEKGAFLGYKKCFNNRLVQLLIPQDGKRTSATANSCRCNKAKVLTIKSFDYKENFGEATSLVDENFIYRVGETLEIKDFNEDRWRDSTTGIHFWLTREEALKY